MILLNRQEHSNENVIYYKFLICTLDSIHYVHGMGGISSVDIINEIIETNKENIHNKVIFGRVYCSLSSLSKKFLNGFNSKDMDIDFNILFKTCGEDFYNRNQIITSEHLSEGRVSHFLKKLYIEDNQWILEIGVVKNTLGKCLDSILNNFSRVINLDVGIDFSTNIIHNVDINIDNYLENF